MPKVICGRWKFKWGLQTPKGVRRTRFESVEDKKKNTRQANQAFVATVQRMWDNKLMELLY
jgi:hypothetical protein